MLKWVFLSAVAASSQWVWAQDNVLTEADIAALNNRLPIVYGEIVKIDAASDVVINVLANDRDPDEDELTIISAEAKEGSVGILEGKRLHYIAPPMSEGGHDTVVYTVHDGKGPRDSVEAMAQSKTVHFDLMIEFDELSVSVPAFYLEELARLAAMMKVTPGTKVQLESFLPATGGSELKKKLSQWRARAVAGVLVKKHDIPASQIDIIPPALVSGSDVIHRRVQLTFHASVHPLVSSVSSEIEITVRPRYLPPPPPPLPLEEVSTELVVPLPDTDAESVVDDVAPTAKKGTVINRRERMKWYGWFDVGLASGEVNTEAFKADLLSSGATEVSINTQTDRLGWQLGLGYRIAPYWAIELGFVDLGNSDVSARIKTPDPAASVDIASGYHPASSYGLSLGTRFMFPISRSLSFIANGGVWAWQSDYSVRSNYAPRAEGREDGVDVLYGFGVNKAFFQELDVRVMWQNYGLDNTDVDFLSIGVTFRFDGL